MDMECGFIKHEDSLLGYNIRLDYTILKHMLYGCYAESLSLKENYRFKTDIYVSVRLFMDEYASYYELMNSFQSINPQQRVDSPP